MIDTIIGTVGMLFILTAFILDEFVKKFNPNTAQYNILNIIGSGLLIYYSYTLDSWPFFILNLVWLITAGVKLVRIMKR